MLSRCFPVKRKNQIPYAPPANSGGSIFDIFWERAIDFATEQRFAVNWGALTPFGSGPGDSGSGSADDCADIGAAGRGTLNLLLPRVPKGAIVGAFDSNGLLTGLKVDLGLLGLKIASIWPLSGGHEVTIPGNTALTLSWSNGTLPGSFQFNASNPLIVDSANISAVRFNGAFSVTGNWRGVPGSASLVEDALNKDFSKVIAATDFANWLAQSKIPCETFYPRIKRD